MRKSMILLATSCLVAWGAQAALADSTAPIAATAATVPSDPATQTATQPASDSAPVAKPAAPAETVAADPIVCKTQTETGSRVRRNKICMTQSEWEAQRQAARRYKENIDRSRSGQPGGGG